MLKKLLSLFIVLLAVNVTVVLSQPCVPGPETQPGTYPDSAQGLPHAYANVYYETVITVVVPTDTVVSGFTVPIDSIGIVAVNGLPTGFSYTPNRPSGYWPGGTKGCVLLSGMHPNVGTFPLSIQVQGYAAGMSVPFNITFYTIHVDSTHLSVENVQNNAFEVYQNMPNPFTGITEISFNSDINGTFNFEVFDMIGQRIYANEIRAQKGLNTVNFDGASLTQGIYFYKISNSARSFTKRMVVAAN